MRKSEITPGAECYYAPARGAEWRIVSPVKAVVVDAAPVRIVRRAQGPFVFVSHTPDPAGNAVVVDLHEGGRVRREAVPVRHLRGLWKATLAKTGRTEAGVKALDAWVHEVATSGREVTGADLVGLAARDEGVSDDVFGVLSQAADGRDIDI